MTSEMTDPECKCGWTFRDAPHICSDPATMARGIWKYVNDNATDLFEYGFDEARTKALEFIADALREADAEGYRRACEKLKTLKSCGATFPNCDECECPNELAEELQGGQEGGK